MAWYSLAQLEKRQGNRESSEKAFQEFEKARALRARLANLRESVLEAPRDVARLLEYAQALLEREKPHEALGPLRRAGELDPGSVQVPRLLERAYEQVSELAGRRRRLEAEAAASAGGN
jgi:predicted Zn-dependent protease